MIPTQGAGAAAVDIRCDIEQESENDRECAMLPAQRAGWNLGGDASVIGNALAIALTGTLYGCMLQNLVAGPISEKLALRSHEEVFGKEIILQGVLAIQAGNNPRVVEMQLLSFLSTKQQATLAKAA